MNRKTAILIGFILLKFILQYTVISPVYDLQRDEYLHLDQGYHLAWGYLSVPPFTSWISYLIHLLGNSLFWVRFFPALFGALTIVMVWKAVNALNGSLFACILAATCLQLSILVRLNTLFQPNSFDVLSWTTIYYCLLRYQQQEQPGWLYSGAVAFALGFLNKYNVLFLAIGFLPAILVTPQRKILAKKELYFAILLALVIVTPNLLWQYHNHFPVVHHMKELADTQLVNVNRADFLKGQLFFFFGAFYVIPAAVIALLFYKPFRKHQSFFWSLLFTLAVFMYFKAKDYYAIGLYPIYLAFGAVYLSNLVPARQQKIWYPVFLFITILFFVPIYRLTLPNKTPQYIMAHQEKYKKYGMLRWEDGKDHKLPQDFADMLGWQELAAKVDSVYSTLPDREHTLILCDNYGQAGAINFYTRKGIKAASFNADYINWMNLTIRYTNLIRVKEYDEKGDELATSSPYFQTSKLAAEIENSNAREYGTAIFAFTGARINIAGRINDEITEVKNEWK